HLHGDLDDAQVLLMRERGAFARGAAGHQEVHARGDLPARQMAQRGFIERTVATKRSNHRCTASSEHGVAPLVSVTAKSAVSSAVPLTDHFPKLEPPFFPRHPARRLQRAARETFAAASGVPQGYGIRRGIEAYFVRTRMGAGTIRAQVDVPRITAASHF